jgi:quercetin dioxygenase-like cupin family protein
LPVTPLKEKPLPTLASDAVVTDTITITHVPGAPELMRLAPGVERRWDDHATDHHIVVVDGTCRVLDRRIHAGGSVYVPAGIGHAVKAGAWGCTFFSVESVNQAV